MDDVPIAQCRPNCAMQSVFEIHVAVPADRVREQVAIERRVLREELVQCQHRGDGDQLVEAQLAGRDLGPVPDRQLVVRVRLSVSDALENH